MVSSPFSGAGGRRAIIGVLVVALLAAARGGSRPSAEDWLPAWEAVVAAIPDEADVGAESDQDVCTDALAMLRTSRSDLFPTPDLAIEETARTWFEVAEDAFFECPPSNDGIGSFAEAYREMRSLDAEIGSVLTDAGG